ncbi:MAG: peptide-methionine (S)-S-oxide reductase MsrA [Acidiferrobacter sp.]
MTDVPASPLPSAVAVLAGGCFWCVEAVYRALPGVLSVEPGYCGGSAESAHYPAVCSGRTDHAEAVRITFAPALVSYDALLTVFFTIAHDPTQKDRQDHDHGRQYRSAIFYADDDQRRRAQAQVAALTARGAFAQPIVTEIVPLLPFYPAEPDHHDYAARHPEQPYIRQIAAPKVQKLRHYLARAVVAPVATGEDH